MKYDKKSIEARKQNNKIAKKIIDIILIILTYNIILVAISNINTEKGMSLFGCEAYIIKTNSMEPSIKNGDVIITKKVPEEKIQVGDIITFKQDADIITHRISRIEEENGKKYITKGDNNNIEDSSKITYQEIKGKEIITIPYLGKIINILQNKIVFWIILLIILIMCFYKIQKQEKSEIRREKKKIEDAKKQES